MASLAAGDLDRRITIERAQMSRSATNSKVETWTPLATVWAAKADLSDRERIAAQEAGADVTTRFRIRWSNQVAGVNPKDRITLDGLVYAITGVKEIGRRVGLEITATARADTA